MSSAIHPLFCLPGGHASSGGHAAGTDAQTAGTANEGHAAADAATDAAHAGIAVNAAKILTGCYGDTCGLFY